MEEEALKESLLNAKEYIKTLSINEKSLKSISFSISEEKKEFIVYFTWKKENYDNFYSDRDNFRESVKSYMKSIFFSLNFTKSNPAKYTFYLRNVQK